MNQDLLHRLAHERPLITPELHLSNDFYGHATILKRYAGIPQRRPLKVAIEHGINLSQEVWQADLHSPFSIFLCASQRDAARFDGHAPPHVRAVPIGPLIRYLPPDDGPDRDSLGRLLIIPAHSTHHVEVTYDLEGFLDRSLESYGGCCQVEVCLYWRDVLRGAADEYARRGLRCVTAGHIHDPAFVIRFRRILRRASAVVTNEIGTHLFYSVLEGKPVWYVEQPVSWSAESPEILERDLPRSEDPERGREVVRRLFAEPRAEPSEEQREFVEWATGINQLRSASELREILDVAERNYRRRYSMRERATRRGRRMARNAVDRWDRGLESIRGRYPT